MMECFFVAMVMAGWLTTGMREPVISEYAKVLIDMEASTEHEVIARMIGLLADLREVRDAEELQRAVLERQKLQPPLLGHGIALPHARTPAVTKMVLAIGRCKTPVPFGPERIPVLLVFLFGVPTHCISGYLDVVAQLTRVLKDPATLEILLTTTDENEFRKLLP